MKTLVIGASILSLLTAATVQSADITWQTPVTISGTSDVNTQGTLYGSWAPGDDYGGGNRSDYYPVNGVIFAAYGTGGVDFNISGSGINMDRYNGFANPNTGDANYNYLLQVAEFNWNAGSSSMIVSWDNMIVGHTYLVQAWLNDGRGCCGSGTSTFTGGVNTSAAVAIGNGVPGQYIIGTFVADSSGSQSFTMSPGIMLNLLQVRDITPMPNVTWGAPAAVSGTSDVSTKGTFFGSWAPGDDAYNPDTLPVNGVTFNAYGSLPGLRSTGFDSHYTSFNEPSTSDANYNTILQAAIYNSTGNPAVATWFSWGGMTAGHTYLVQIWANDGRGNDRSETFTGGVNTSAALNFGNAPGEFITGTFVANSSGAETIILNGSASDNGDYPQLNLVQVRDITLRITSISVSGTTLNLTAANGVSGGQFVLHGTTNPALPLSQWTPLLTNNFDVNGNLTLSTNILNPAVTKQFFILSQ